MTLKKPRKYKWSTYNNKVITSICVIKGVDDLAWIKLFHHDEELVMIPLWIFYDEANEYSADYLLCDIQDVPELEVLK